MTYIDKQEIILLIYTSVYFCTNIIYFKNSFVLTLIKWFPIVQVLLIIIFITFGYLSLNSARRAQQNMVWVGMAKETAHQIGTPLSSLVGWAEIFKTENVNQDYIKEMEKDIDRLEILGGNYNYR